MKAIQFATISNFRKSPHNWFHSNIGIGDWKPQLQLDNVFFHSKVQYSIEMNFFPNSWQLSFGTYEVVVVVVVFPFFLWCRNTKIEVNTQGDLMDIDRL